MGTKTAVIIVSPNRVEIWVIPPLSSQPPDFSVDHYPTHMLPPLFTIPFPDDVALYPERMQWIAMSSWYFGSSHPLYFDMLREDSNLKCHRVQIMLNLKPDLSTASLHVINTSELTPRDFDHVSFQDYQICEDTVVSCWFRWDNSQCGVYTQSTSASFANVVSHAGLSTKMSPPNIEDLYRLRLSSCPASGRLVLLDHNNTVSVLDFF